MSQSQRNREKKKEKTLLQTLETKTNEVFVFHYGIPQKILKLNIIEDFT